MTPSSKRGSSTRISRDIKEAILRAIAEHVRVFGRTNYDLLREQPAFAPVIGRASGTAGKRRFWRWVHAVSEPPPADKTRPHETRAAAADALSSATERARAAAQRNLPAAPSPAYLMRDGAQAAKNIDFLAAVHTIWADAELLREHAMKADNSGGGGKCIGDAGIFDASIKRRLDVMDSALRVMREIWDLKYQQTFYDAITNVIVNELAAVPEIQERVCRKLAELNSNLGMTIQMETR